MKGHPIPVSAWPNTVSLKEKPLLLHTWPPHTPGRVARQQKEPPTAVNQAPTSRPNLRPLLSTTYTARQGLKSIGSVGAALPGRQESARQVGLYIHWIIWKEYPVLLGTSYRTSKNRQKDIVWLVMYN